MARFGRRTETPRPARGGNLRQERLPEFGVYSSFEVGLKRKYTKWRGYVLSPFVSILARLGIRPDWVSFSGWVAALVMYLIGGTASYAVLGWITVLYVLLDNLDGALAEMVGKNDFGQIVDNFFDLTSLWLILLLLARLSLVPGSWLFVFSIFYALILVGGFLANYNRLSVLILRVRILVIAPFLLVALAGLSDSILRYAVTLGLLLQLFSMLSIFGSLTINFRRVRFPRILSQASASTTVLGILALAVDLLLFAGYLFTRVHL
jgi:phosphatidylglycerophosphate synthase